MSRQTTHVVILAAGRGSRLGDMTESTPKWLLNLDGVTLAEQQLAAVAEARQAAPDSIASVRVVVGHAAEAIRRFSAERPDEALELIDNPEHARLNNWYSVLLGIDHVGDPDARIVVINGDLFVPAGWMTQFLVDSATGPSDSLIAIDMGRPPSEEDMKVALGDDGIGDGFLEAIGKVGVRDPRGAYIGIFMAGGPVLRGLRSALADMVGVAEAENHWYEHAIDRMAGDGLRWRAWRTPDSGWVEIDDENDREAALALLSRT